MTLLALGLIVSVVENTTLVSSTWAQRNNEVITSKVRQGELGWKLDPSADAWAVKETDIEFLKLHTVEAILSVTPEKVRALRIDGKPNSDLEAYLRLRLQSNEKYSFPMTFKRKTRSVLIRIPQPGSRMEAQARFLKPYTNVYISSSGAFQSGDLIGSELTGNDSRLQCISFLAPLDAKFASIAATVSVSSIVPAVSAKVGQKFVIAGNEFEIQEIRPFKSEDAPMRNTGFQKYRTSFVIKSLSGKSINLICSISRNDYLTGYDPYLRVFVNQDGDIATKKVTDQNDWAGMTTMPSIENAGKSLATGEIVFLSNVNANSLKTLSFTLISSYQARLENIPID